MVAVPLLKVTLAPVLGTVKVTEAPDTGLPWASVTVTTSGLVKAVATVALCRVPKVALMLDGVPAVLVRLKVAGLEAPATEAVTDQEADHVTAADHYQLVALAVDGDLCRQAVPVFGGFDLEE